MEALSFDHSRHLQYASKVSVFVHHCLSSYRPEEPTILTLCYYYAFAAPMYPALTSALTAFVLTLDWNEMACVEYNLIVRV